MTARKIQVLVLFKLSKINFVIAVSDFIQTNSRVATIHSAAHTLGLTLMLAISYYVTWIKRTEEAITALG